MRNQDDVCRVAELVVALLELGLPGMRTPEWRPIREAPEVVDESVLMPAVRRVYRAFGLRLSESRLLSGYTLVSSATKQFFANRGFDAELDVTTIRAVNLDAGDVEFARLYPVAQALLTVTRAPVVTTRFHNGDAAGPVQAYLSMEQLQPDGCRAFKTALDTHQRSYGRIRASFSIGASRWAQIMADRRAQHVAIARSANRARGCRLTELIDGLLALGLPLANRPGWERPFISLKGAELAGLTAEVNAVLQPLGLTLSGPWTDGPRQLLSEAVRKYLELRGLNASLSLDDARKHSFFTWQAPFDRALALAHAVLETRLTERLHVSCELPTQEHGSRIEVFLSVPELRPDNLEQLRRAITREQRDYRTVHVSFNLTKLEPQHAS